MWYSGWRLRGRGFDSRIGTFFFTPFFFFFLSHFFFFLSHSPPFFSLQARSAISMLKHFSSRGGASEASVAATLTMWMAARDIHTTYDTCAVKPLGQLLHAHAQMLLSQQFSKFIFTGKGNSGKKDLLL